MLRSIKSEARQQRVINLRVTGTGTATINEGIGQATLTDNGTGDYTITFATRFVRAPVVVVTTGTASTIARVGTLAVNSVQILTTNLSAVATDAIFHVQITGWDAAS
jgi:hypothetical protein